MQELADLARMRLSQMQQGFGQQGFGQQGFGQQGFGQQQSQAGPPQGGARGWEAEPQPIRQGNSPGNYGAGNYGNRDYYGGDGLGSIGDDIAGAVIGEAAKFIGRAIGRRAQRAYSERVQPAMAANQEALLRNQIAIAERHPDLRACMNDQVIFLAGGSRVLPFPNLMTLTIDQADAMVATLRSG